MSRNSPKRQLEINMVNPARMLSKYELGFKGTALKNWVLKEQL